MIGLMKITKNLVTPTMKNNVIDWNVTYAAIWRQRLEYLRPIRRLDPVRLGDLLGIDSQKQQLQNNTERFLGRHPANNALLWGARGTGKSSLVKALLNEYQNKGLRIIEIDKMDLIYLPEIVDTIRELPQRFIIYCDDLSFEVGNSHFKSLKSVMEGSVELPPENILIYATSNRRHLLPEYMRDNLDTRLVDGEVHYSDTIEELISLSDRFGLSLAFYPQPMSAYLAIVDSLFPDPAIDRDYLHRQAREFAHTRAAHSGRTAKQFYNAVTENS
jgi:predicted AAA+ superfamily ATPase